MNIAISLVIAVLFSFAVAKILKKYSLLFYVLAALISFIGVYFTWNPSNLEILRGATFVIQKGQLGFSLFAVVMFIGVFGKDTKIRRLLTPVRAELSILASILIFGHFVPYLISYTSMLGNLVTLRQSMLVSLFIALLLLILLLFLVVTSFNVIKKRMTKKSWLFVQRFAYLFFILVFIHLCGFLIVPASAGSLDASISLIIYGVVLLLYVVLRVRRSLLDKTSKRIIEAA